MNATLTPYLGFNGTCAEAMTFYQSILGGELKMQTFGEAMPKDTPPGIANNIIHASLSNGTLSFMASDCPPGQEAVFGNSVSLSIVGSDEAKLREYFAKLAEGGTIAMPLDKQFWGDIFGAFKDKYGIHWMVNIGEMKE